MWSWKQGKLRKIKATGMVHRWKMTPGGIINPEVVPGKPCWKERRDYIMSLLDKYNRLVHNHSPKRIHNQSMYHWLGGERAIAVSEKDFDRLIKMGWVKKERSMNRSWYVRAIPKQEEVVQEPREPYKKRKMAIAELEKSIMNKSKGRKHERVPQSNSASSVVG